MSVRKRIENALKRETGVRLSAAEVQGIAVKLGIGVGNTIQTEFVPQETSEFHGPVEKRNALNVNVRWMIRRDMPTVQAIETASFESPWAEEDFLRCLRQRNCIGMVAEHDEQVVGYMIYELHKDRIHVLNFAVSPFVKRKSIGQQMAQKLISKLNPKTRNQIHLHVADFNVDAQQFFSAMGFKAVGIDADWYDKPAADGIEFQAGRQI